MLSIISEDWLYNAIFAGGIAFAIISFFAIVLLKGFLGSYGGKGTPTTIYGHRFDPRLGWFIAEYPAMISFHYFYWSGPNAFKPVPCFCAFVFTKHYINRGWFFPWSIRVSPNGSNSFSLAVVATAMVFTTIHGYLNACWFSKLGHHLESSDWFYSPFFIFGYAMYEASFIFTLYSETIMRNLRAPEPGQFDLANFVFGILPGMSWAIKKPVEQAATKSGSAQKGSRYVIPTGGGFNYVTNPQYLGELVGWFSWIFWAKNPAGIVIFLVSAANLVPRAFEQHQWYKQKFDNYPKERKALIPFIA